MVKQLLSDGFQLTFFGVFLISKLNARSVHSHLRMLIFYRTRRLAQKFFTDQSILGLILGSAVSFYLVENY